MKNNVNRPNNPQEKEIVTQNPDELVRKGAHGWSFLGFLLPLKFKRYEKK